jgi:hypothetical protein
MEGNFTIYFSTESSINLRINFFKHPLSISPLFSPSPKL